MNKLQEFVQKAIKGEIMVEGSVVVDNKIVEGLVILSKNPENITSEAFNQGLFDVNTSWVTAINKVTRLISNNDG
jgi:hypothetical protein